MNKNGKHTRHKRPVPLFSVYMVPLLVVIVSLSAFIGAKYISMRQNDTVAKAKSFYFESDMLADASGAIPQYTLQAGVNTISFSLMNYPDELRESEVEISYSAVLTKDGAQLASKSGSIGAGRNTVSVSFDDLEAGTYVVTATSTGPYTQTLQGIFTIVDTSYDLSYNVLDGIGSPNLKVTVTTTDYSGNIEISWPDGVLPDNTDPLLENVSGQSCTIKVEAQSEYTFQFFKTDPESNYTERITVKKPDS